MRERTAFRCIGVKEADALVKDARTLLLDVRAADAFGAAHMDRAHHVTFSGLSEIIGGTAKTTPVLIYCYHGHASREFAQTLSDFGFKEVYSLDGGYEAWTSWEQAQVSSALPGVSLAAWLVGQGFAADGVDMAVDNGMTPLMKAAREGLEGIVEALIAAGVRLNARNTDGNTALWLACVGNHLGILDRLAAAGIDIDNRNDNGATALMYAASAGKAPVVERLLVLGADPLPETLDGFSALDLAATRECLDLLRRAARSGAPRVTTVS